MKNIFYLPLEIVKRLAAKNDDVVKLVFAILHILDQLFNFFLHRNASVDQRKRCRVDCCGQVPAIVLDNRDIDVDARVRVKLANNRVLKGSRDDDFAFSRPPRVRGLSAVRHLRKISKNDSRRDLRNIVVHLRVHWPENLGQHLRLSHADFRGPRASLDDRNPRLDQPHLVWAPAVLPEPRKLVVRVHFPRM